MTDLTETRRPLWLCIWPTTGGGRRLTVHGEQPDATGALVVLQVRGEMSVAGPVEVEIGGTPGI